MQSSDTSFPTSPPRAWAEIRLNNLRHNLHVVRKHQPGEVMTILKANAYGHGMKHLATYLKALPKDETPFCIGVASVIEARRLADCECRISLLGPTTPIEREEIVFHNWTPGISNFSEAEHFNLLAKKILPHPLAVHITVDTGMGRGGYLPHELSSALKKLKSLTHLHIEGIGSHLPSADEDESFTQQQIKQFDSLVESLGTDNFQYRHIANSAGLLNYQSRTSNLCRPGLMLYGISPLPEFQNELKPVMTLKSRVSLVRTLPAGHGVSYGRDTILSRETKVATVGIGYGDGYPHTLSGKHSEVLIHGTRCPVLGRITMDQIMVDVSALPHCQSGDEVELFGENILVSELATLANTIPWAIFTGITPRVTRIFFS